MPRLTRPPGSFLVVALAMLASIAACGADDEQEAQPPPDVRVPPAEWRPKPGGGLPEKVARRPDSPCGWMSAAEVEAVVGKLNAPPQTKEGGCFYPLPIDSITLARNAKSKQVEEALARAGMKSDWPAMPEDTGGVLIHVTPGGGAEERPMELGFATAGSWVGEDSLLTSKGGGDGWDWRQRIIGKPNFWGRAGTLMVVVEGGTYGMDDDVLAALAARVRDRIPDLPFAEPAASTAVRPGPDPCGILSRSDAEAVLGRLVVAPYRVREGGALADPGGRSCAYYSGRHRALVLTPHFADGADELRSIRARGGLGAIGVVDRAAEAGDTLEGPWDEAALGAYGQLAALKGDRMLEIAYLTSSTDLAGAIRLAAAALPRLAAAR